MVLPENSANRLRSLERREVSLHPFEKMIMGMGPEPHDASLTDDQENPTPAQTPTRTNRKSVLSPHVSSPRALNTVSKDFQHTTVDRISKSHSKTALGRLTYELDSTPKLLGVQLIVESMTDSPNSWEHVGSARLRRQAIEAWLERMGLNGLATIVAQDKDGKATLAIRYRNETHMSSIQRTLASAQSDVPDVKRTKRSSGTDSKQYALRIRSQEIQHVTKDVAGISSDFRAVMRGLIPLERLPESVLNVDARLPEVKKFDKKNAEPEIFHVHELQVRVEPTLDLTANNPRLHLGFDIVPVMPKRALVDVLKDLVGRKKESTKPISDNIVSIARTLRGLNVRCIYKPLESTTIGGDKVLTHISLLKDQQRSEGRRFQIKNLDLPCNVKHYDGNGKEVKFSLEKYFGGGRFHISYFEVHANIYCSQRTKWRKGQHEASICSRRHRCLDPCRVGRGR
jgi:hypothetical protein